MPFSPLIYMMIGFPFEIALSIDGRRNQNGPNSICQYIAKDHINPKNVCAIV